MRRSITARMRALSRVIATAIAVAVATAIAIAIAMASVRGPARTGIGIGIAIGIPGWVTKTCAEQHEHRHPPYKDPHHIYGTDRSHDCSTGPEDNPDGRRAQHMTGRWRCCRPARERREIPSVMGVPVPYVRATCARCTCAPTAWTARSCPPTMGRRFPKRLSLISGDVPVCVSLASVAAGVCLRIAPRVARGMA